MINIEHNKTIIMIALILLIITCMYNKKRSESYTILPKLSVGLVSRPTKFRRRHAKLDSKGRMISMGWDPPINRDTYCTRAECPASEAINIYTDRCGRDKEKVLFQAKDLVCWTCQKE